MVHQFRTNVPTAIDFSPDGLLKIDQILVTSHLTDFGLVRWIALSALVTQSNVLKTIAISLGQTTRMRAVRPYRQPRCFRRFKRRFSNASGAAGLNFLVSVYPALRSGQALLACLRPRL